MVPSYVLGVFHNSLAAREEFFSRLLGGVSEPNMRTDFNAELLNDLSPAV